MRRAFIAVVVVMACATVAAADSFEDAVAPNERGDDPLATRLLRPFGEQGDARAQVMLGAMSATGHGVPQDQQQPVKWYRKASEQGLPFAQFSLAETYRYGRGEDTNLYTARNCYYRAAPHGHVKAQATLTQMGRLANKDPEMAQLLDPLWARGSLKNLPPIFLEIELVSADAQADGLSREEIYDAVALILRSSGIQVEHGSRAKTSEFSKAKLSPALAVRVSTLKLASGVGYAYFVNVGLTQLVSLPREPADAGPMFGITWERTLVGTTGARDIRQIGNSVESLPKEFARDFQKVNPR